MVIMLFGTAMPLLYPAGIVLCGCMYWSSKCLFLRFYKSPPQFDLSLAHRVRSLLEWSVVLHLAFGLYMLTTPGVLIIARQPASGDERRLLIRIGMRVGELLQLTFGINKYRFSSVPGTIYLIGTIIFMILFALEKATGVLSASLNADCCCLKKYIP